jgi:hypothetical protein
MIERRHEYRALDSKVLAVAVQGGHPLEWAAYIGAVPGENHLAEYEAVYRHGSKLSEKVAQAIFPYFATENQYYRS